MSPGDVQPAPSAQRNTMRTSEFQVAVVFAGGLVTTAFATSNTVERVTAMVCATAIVCAFVISRGLAKRAS